MIQFAHQISYTVQGRASIVAFSLSLISTLVVFGLVLSPDVWPASPDAIRYAVFWIPGLLLITSGWLFIHLRNCIWTQKKYTESLESEMIKRSTELRKTTMDLERTQQQLMQSERMASLGQLTAGIAHEIKNPLNFVNNFSAMSTQILNEIKEEAQKYEDAIPDSFRDELYALLDDMRIQQEKINKHGRRANGIVQSMLAHSRSGPGERRVIDLNCFVDEFIGLAYHGICMTDGKSHVRIERNFDPEVGLVQLMPQEMGQVLVNLLNNALYAVQERASSEGEDYQPTVTVSTRCLDAWIKLCVGDNGTGIPGRLKEKIFEPFFTTKPVGDGTGLGLSLSYDIITKGHGGKLEVESVEGQGSQFTISLPRV